MNIVITGTSRGIGLELTRQALANDHHVIAVLRKLSQASEIQNLQKKYPKNLKVVEADVTQSIDAVLAAAKDLGSVDILINNAGILRKEDRPSDFVESYAVNVMAPHFLTQAMRPYLKKGKNPRVVNITSLMGSLSDNSSGGYYSYRSSKSALNMVTVSLAKDEPWLTAIMIHPGWVQTEMGGAQAPLAVKDSALGVWSVIQEAGLAMSGKFLDYRGQSIQW